MIDFGLVVALIVGFGLPALVERRWPLESYPEPTGVIDAVIGPAFVGLAAGRLTALALDDPQALTSVADIAVFRSGVEFWAALAAGAAVLAWGAQRAGIAPLVRLADVAPLFMIGYGGFEATCVVRDGCFGPASPIGLRPPDVATTMLPVGLLLAGALWAGAVGVRWLARNGARHGIVVLSAVGSVAGLRAGAAFWLPQVGDGLNRAHRTSIAMALLATGVLAAVVVTGRRARVGQATP